MNNCFFKIIELSRKEEGSTIKMEILEDLKIVSLNYNVKIRPSEGKTLFDDETQNNSLFVKELEFNGEVIEFKNKGEEKLYIKFRIQDDILNIINNNFETYNFRTSEDKKFTALYVIDLE